MTTEFRILGPLEAVDEGRRLAIGSAKQRALLAILVLHANEVVSTDRLIDGIWGAQPPQTAPKIVQVYVSQLRKALGQDRLVTRAPGYLLRVEPDELDAERYEHELEAGRAALAAGDPRTAAATLRGALAIWRGPPLADFTFEPFAEGATQRLEERRLAGVVERVEADLALGRHGELVAELEALVGEHPLQERIRGQLMLALYRSGRQAEALQAYQDGRRALGEELGLQPGPALQQLEQAILRQDASLDLPASGQAPPAPAPARRAPAPTRDVTFPELVWEHFQWQRERAASGSAGADTEARYRAARTAFEAREGRILDAYWCRREASAAALTLRRPSLARRLLRAEPTLRLHRATDWITRDAPAVADLLFRCDTLALRADSTLRGPEKRQAISRIFAAETHLLGLLERTGGDASRDDPGEALDRARVLLDSVERALEPPAAPGRGRERS
jgi:DNA-binding SARP family transcriptional activator